MIIDWALLGTVALQAITLTFMLIGLFGLIIPIFPGLTVIWLAALVYAIVDGFTDKIGVLGWVMFAFITILMVVGNVVDNLVIAKKVRETGTPWMNILLAVAAGVVVSFFLTPLIGLFAAPVALYLAEYRRLRDKVLAFASTKAYLIGFGTAFFIRFGMGMVMIVLWLIWAWG
jgi:hypothetical protein